MVKVRFKLKAKRKQAQLKLKHQTMAEQLQKHKVQEYQQILSAALEGQRVNKM